MVGWSVWQRYLHDDDDYNAITVNAYASADQLGATDYQAWFKKASAGKNDSDISRMNDFFQNTDKYRKIVKAQLWELVDTTEPAPKKEAGK